VAQKSKSGLGRLVLRFINRNFAHTLGSTPMNAWSALRRGRYPHNTQQTRRTPKPFRGIRNRDHSNQAAATLSLRPPDHQNRLQIFGCAT